MQTNERRASNRKYLEYNKNDARQVSYRIVIPNGDIEWHCLPTEQNDETEQIVFNPAKNPANFRSICNKKPSKQILTPLEIKSKHEQQIKEWISTKNMNLLQKKSMEIIISPS